MILRGPHRKASLDALGLAHSGRALPPPMTTQGP